MITVRFATLIGTAAALLVSTSARAQDVSYDYDRSANFAGYTSYAWVNGARVADDLTHQRIVGAVDRQLAAKGVHKADAIAGADLLVTYHAVVGEAYEVNGNRLGLNRWASARVESVPVGALAVELIDARTRQVVWRGLATKDLNPKASPEEREKNMNRAAEKLFKHYPPATAQ